MPLVPEMEIRPYQSFGPVRFGLTRKEVIGVLGPPDFTHPRTGGLWYDRFGINVGCDRNGRCNWMASGPPCVPIVEGMRLVGRFDDVVSALGERGYKVRHGRSEEADRGSAYCDALGIYFGREDADDQRIDTVAVWARGYWEGECSHA